MLAVVAKLFGAGAALWLGSKLVGGSSGGGAPPVKQGTFGVYLPEGNGEVTQLDASEEIGRSGGSLPESTDYTLRELVAGESVELVVDLALTTYIAPSNRYYINAAGHQFCEGLRITATAKRTATGVQLSSVAQQPNATICASLIGEGVDASLQIPWPSKAYAGTRPTVELRATSDAVVMRVTAPALKFSERTAVPGEGYGPEFWSKVGPYRYTLRLSGSLRVT